MHGDAHAGNLLRTTTGWAWIDLEETCRGPCEFDLLVLTRSVAPQWQAHVGDDLEADGQVALAANASELGTSVPNLAALAPFGHARDVQAVVWLLGMAH